MISLCRWGTCPNLVFALSFFARSLEAGDNARETSHIATGSFPGVYSGSNSRHVCLASLFPRPLLFAEKILAATKSGVTSGPPRPRDVTAGTRDVGTATPVRPQ